MPRIAKAAAALAFCALGAGAAGAAAAPTTTAPATTPTAPTAAPKLDSLRLPATVTAQQGHARFLVGVRLATPSKLTIQVISAAGKVVQTKTDVATRRAGRAYVRIEAVDNSGFQMLRGKYTLKIQATDASGRVSPTVQGPFTLKLTTARGVFDAYTVPLWKAFRRQAGASAQGQLIAVPAPKGVVVGAGMRRGDIVTKVNGVSVAQPGAWSVAMRGLQAGKATNVEYVRRGVPTTVQITPKPDWEAAPDYAKSLDVAVERAPADYSLAVAQARQLIDSAKLADAQNLVAAWRPAWRTGAPGQLVQGDLYAKAERWKQALGAYNRARKKDPAMAAAEFGRGVALSELDKTGPAAQAFAASARLDPTDPAAPGFQAYALLKLDKTPEALVAARTAVSLDPRYADGFLPYGIALIAGGDKTGGVKALRRGLILLEEPDRADRLIAQNLDPADP